VKKRYASIVRSLLGMLDLEEESNMILQNINNYLLHDAASYSRRMESSEPISWHFLNVLLSINCLLNRQHKVTTMQNIGSWEGGWAINYIISQTSQNWVHYDCFF
jgi:hypothetical protein